ncbi:MFS drug efflux [Colletotrichum chrysophilum]|uniref:MFS drug efflux n=1 Tax=Colletotrichum chrysophilum TaxID=1836956 RepID=A0AAD9EJB0_9PEZI|nr:MFS drug efflux [Colletotrichum chrysophilum]
MNAVIIGRLICGIGGAGSATTTIAERPLYISGTGITWGLGTALGPVLGGAFEQLAVGWRWAFYINLFIGAVCAPAYIFLLPSVDPRPGVSPRERASQLDYAVVAIFVNGLLMARFGYYMLWYLVGSLISVGGGALMYLVDCIFIQASFSVAQAVVDPKNVAAVIGFMTLAKYLGNTTALAIANSLLGSSELSSRPSSKTEISGVAGGFVQKLDDGIKARVVDAIVDSISKTYILVMTAGALVALLSLFMKWEKLFINASVTAC